jgi:hypothetical protein
MGCQNFASGDHLRRDFQRLTAEYYGVDERCKRASLDGMEQRSEPRRDERLVVTIQGRDNAGQFFIQGAVASSVSTSGALLSGICREVRPGDLVWVEYAGTKSRFRVVWLRDSESHQLIQAAVHLLKEDPCPWAKSS